MTPAQARAPWLLDFLLLAAIWGSSFMFSQIATREFGAFPTAGLRVIIAAAVLVPLLVLRGQWSGIQRHWKMTMAVGVVNSAIPFVCFTYALLSITTGLTSIINATVPMFGALVAWLWLKDRPTGSRILGLCIGFLGIAMLAWDKASFRPDANGSSSGLAVLACLFATLCYGVAASLAKRFMGGLPSLVSATGSQLGASALLLPFTLIYWPAQSVSLAAWLSVIVAGVVCTGLAYIVYFRLIERAGPSRALAVTFGIPVFANLYGIVLLGEQLTVWMVFCALVIVAGTLLSTGLVKLGAR
jgi:drug/metabolite transporter (DMT)-like permease